jgi:2,3-bisphosphoglycerate-independent phosphoglycerate mutase
MITDGRDTAPRAALDYLDEVESALAELGRGRVATVTGRYCAMDRARHWDRTLRAWDAIVMGQGLTADGPREAIEAAYARGEGDEFIQPTVIAGHAGIDPDEPVLVTNFRSDRVRQLTAAFGLDDFQGFDRGGTCLKKIVCMTAYDEDFPFEVLFSRDIPARVLAEVVSDAGLAQLHCSETEKFAHVTYFFNGGREAAFPGEQRIIVDSPAVATYDLEPEMSAAAIAVELIGAIESGKYDLIITNFANADMVGHTARREAIVRAVETLDLQSHRVFQVALENNWRILLTADHGNCDEMIDPNTGEPHTQHTEYPVPFLIMGAGPVRLSTGRGLADIAPTILELLGVPQPPEMTGRSLMLKRRLR